jgi:preprotein translocase subunit Sec61beta
MLSPAHLLPFAVAARYLSISLDPLLVMAVGLFVILVVVILVVGKTSRWGAFY